MYKTITVKANFTEEEKAFWIDQCEHANSLINCAIYHIKQMHYSKLSSSENAFTTYWRGDDLRYGWKIYRCSTSYPELDKILKDNPHYKAMAAQSAQQTLKTVAESITSYNGLVNLYYKGEVDRPSLPKYRKKGGLASVTITEESYTSKSSFLDDDFLPKHGEKPEGWESSGERVKRGLFKTKKGFLVNADCNGAANIMRKVATQLGLVLVKVGRGNLTVPHRYDLFSDLKKTFRTKLR